MKKLLSEVSKNYSKEKIRLAYLGLAGGLEREKGKRGKIQKICSECSIYPTKGGTSNGRNKIGNRTNKT